MPDIRFTLSALEVVVPAALVAAIIVIAVSRRHRADAATTAWRVAAVAYVAALVSATLFPFQVLIGPYAPVSGDWWDSINPIPLVGLDPRNFLLNIAMTVPLGILLPVLTRRRSLRAVLTAGLATSLGIEVTQYICLRLLSSGRSSDIDDVIANVIGVAIGYAVYRVVAAWRLNSQRRPTGPAARLRD
ncbi:VanZ family protein [uncultured Microbacterium sp.]|uniref:VanZ family protein n=1 Tax=uncultured Microbacterium sp. TaxID=191216 RepID=UPI0028DC91AC|nr:VanZ family protein [uncultured Microbacterium sp.]